jgi:hypothetical protein
MYFFLEVRNSYSVFLLLLFCNYVILHFYIILYVLYVQIRNSFVFFFFRTACMFCIKLCKSPEIRELLSVGGK